MGAGTVSSRKRAANHVGFDGGQFDYWEIKEAFAVVALYAIQELGLDPERGNAHGGGSAIGPPLGASGGRIVGTLCRILEEKQARYGCATMCCGGGQGVAMIVERENGKA